MDLIVTAPMGETRGVARHGDRTFDCALGRAGLVADRGSSADARVRLYRLESGAFGRVRAWLDDVEEFWSDQLQAFKAHAEGGARGRRGR